MADAEPSSPKGAPPAHRYRHFIHLPDHNAVYCQIPKVGCTNWKVVIRRLLGLPNSEDTGLAHNRAENGLSYLSDYDEEGRKAALVGHVFLFVRNPIERVLSAWLNKFDVRCWADMDAGWRYEAEKFAEPATDGLPIISFDAFVRGVAQQSDEEMNEHWAPQTYLSLHGVIRHDFIGRFERLREDSHLTLERIGVEAAFPSPQDIKFPQMRAAQKLLAYYTPELVALMRERFDEDCRVYGYDTPDLLKR